MMGLAVNIFLEWGEREMTGEIKFVAGSTKKEMQEQLAIVTSQLVRKMDEIFLLERSNCRETTQSLSKVRVNRTSRHALQPFELSVATDVISLHVQI